MSSLLGAEAESPYGPLWSMDDGGEIESRRIVVWCRRSGRKLEYGVRVGVGREVIGILIIVAEYPYC